MEVARLVSKRWHNVPGKLKVAELFFDVPLDHSRPDAARIRLFARAVHRRSASIDNEVGEKQLPWLVYLQGGPGMSCGQPQELNWVGLLIDRGYQVLLLDQRGTGLSSAITAATLGRQGDAFRQAEYLRLFRADSIVRDCEAVRKCLTADYPPERKKWSVLGQSFGGFCALNYLSRYPEGLREVYTTGGLPPLVDNPQPVYERTYGKIQERNAAYYNKFPEDIERVTAILNHLEKADVTFRDGGLLTADRFLELGLAIGMKGGLDMVHDIVLRCTSDLEIFGFFARTTLAVVENAVSFDNNILYAMLHESIYCQGKPSGWAADRLKSQFQGFRTAQNPKGIFFTGEMVYKHTFENSPELAQLREVAELIATTDEWPDLYDKEQLARNEVPVYSATYIDDMYVHYDLAKQTAASIKNCKNFVTNTMYHNALRANAIDVIQQLFALRDDTID